HVPVRRPHGVDEVLRAGLPHRPHVDGVPARLERANLLDQHALAAAVAERPVHPGGRASCVAAPRHGGRSLRRRLTPAHGRPSPSESAYGLLSISFTRKLSRPSDAIMSFLLLPSRSRVTCVASSSSCPQFGSTGTHFPSRATSAHAWAAKARVSSPRYMSPETERAGTPAARARVTKRGVCSLQSPHLEAMTS